MSDIHWYQKSVGLSPPKPDFGICQDRLHWKKLKEMKKDHRDAEVIKRANLYAFNWGYIGMKGVDGPGLSRAIWNAKQEKKYSQVRKDIAAPQLDRLRLQFPLLDNDAVRFQVTLSSARQERNPDAARLASEFQKVVADFQKTELCHQLKTMARKLFQSRQVNKLVAFGLGGLSCPTGPGSSITIHVQTQHAALLAIRDIWREEHKGAKDSFDIYLCDPNNWEVDVKPAAHFGMTVVNIAIGHQMGYLLIDEFTLVMDLIGCTVVAPPVFEIARPAGLLSFAPLLDPEIGLLPEPVICSYTLTVHNKERGQKEEIIFPGLGVQVQKIQDPYLAVVKSSLTLARSKTAMVEEGLHEYTEERFDVSKCDVGTYPDWAKQPPPHSKPAGPPDSETVTSKAAHEPTAPTAPMGSTSAGPSKSKTVTSKGTYEPPPPTVQMESTTAGPPNSPSKCKTVKNVASKAKNFKNAAKERLSPLKSKRHSASHSGPSHAEPHSASQAGPSQAGSHTISHSGSSHANPNPAPHTPSDPPRESGRDGQYGKSHLGKIPTLYIRKW